MARLVVFAVLSTLSFASVAQARGALRCDPDTLERSGGPGGYGPIGDHCEGTFAGDVAGGLHVMSVTLGEVRPGPGDAITLSTPLATAATRIVGAALLPTVSYRVDKTVQPAQRFIWSTDRLARTGGVSPREMGFLGLVVATSSDVVTPVCAAPSQGDCRAVVRLLVQVRPDPNVDSLDAKVFSQAAAGGPWSPVGTYQLAPGGAVGGAAVAMSLPTAAGWDAVNIQFRAKRQTQGSDLVTAVTIKLN